MNDKHGHKQFIKKEEKGILIVSAIAFGLYFLSITPVVS